MTYTCPTDAGTLLTDAEVLVNLYYEWNPKHPSVQPTDTGGAYDLKTVLAHELGHALHLGDDQSSNSSTMMRPTIKPHEVRSLDPDDVAGVNYLYP